jgi:drug/metabolite transporter (DMT)-like permease
VNAALWGCLSALSLGTADFMGRFSTRATSAEASYGAVLLVGAIAMSIWVAVDGVPLIWSPSGVALAVLHGFAVAIMSMLLYAGLARGPVSVVAPIVASHPVLVLLVLVALGSRPTALQWAAMLVVLAGAILIARSAETSTVGPSDRSEVRRTLGIAVLSCLFYALLILLGQAAVPLIGSVQTTWTGRLAGLALVVVLALARRRPLGVRRAWVPFLAAQGLADMLGYVALTAGGATANPEITAVVAAGFSVVTVLLGWVILREPIGPLQWLAIAMIAGGSAVLAGGE